MGLGLLFALCTAVFTGTATVFQALGARRVAPGGAGAAVRATWQWPFIVGVALDTLGFGTELLSLRSVPLFLVEAAVAGALAVTAIVSSALLHIRLRRTERAAVGAVCGGLALMAIAAGRDSGGDGDARMRLAVLVGSIGLTLVSWALSLRLGDKRHRAAALGGLAGISFGLVAVAARLLPGLSLPGMLLDPAVYAVIVSGITGYLLLTEALQSGSVTSATAAMVTGETVWPALFGVVWLGDTTRHGFARWQPSDSRPPSWAPSRWPASARWKSRRRRGTGSGLISKQHPLDAHFCSQHPLIEHLLTLCRPLDRVVRQQEQSATHKGAFSAMHEIPAVSRRTLMGGALASGAVVAGLGATAPAHAAAAADTPPARRPGQKSMINVPFDEHRTVRVALIGLGNRGHGMASGWAAVPGCTVTAVCDIRADRARRTADKLVAEGRPRPAEYGGSADAYARMLRREDIDLVYVATPWEFHYEQGRAALLSGRHAIVELPIATELRELWDLVDTSERTRRHLFLSENCSYGRNELAMLKMAHDGLFGDITNGHGGYLHDLRALLFSDTYYTDSWRRLWHTRSTASLYPMHGLAPIAAAMDINRGDRMTTLRATATEPRGLADYRQRFVPRSHPSWKETYINGDLVTCLIDTAQGRVIRAEHEVSSPRPYSRINSLAGSRGIFEDYAGVSSASGGRVYLEPDHSGHTWRSYDTYLKEFDHWLWQKIGDDAANDGGHGGMDYILQWRTVQQMRAGLVPDMDVYDAAVWCSPIPLSVKSLAAGGRPVAVPDFTRGSWVNHRTGLDSRPSEMPPVP